MSPDYLHILLGTLDRDGNADSNRSGVKKFQGKKFLGQIVPGNFGGKAAYVDKKLIKGHVGDSDQSHPDSNH